MADAAPSLYPGAVVLVRFASPADAEGVAAVRRSSWPAAYSGLIPPAVIDRVVGESDAARERAGFAARPWRRLLVAETQPAPDPGPAAAPPPTVIGYASYGPERTLAGLPRPARRDPGPASGRPSRAELYTLYVAPDWWSTGTGRALMDRVLAEVRAESYPGIILWVLKENRRARRFYERAGFVRQGSEHPSFAGVPEVRYARALEPRLPAAGAPLTQVRALRAEGGVGPVAGVDRGSVGQAAEHPLLEVVHQRGEVLRAAGLARATREPRCCGRRFYSPLSNTP